MSGPLTEHAANQSVERIQPLKYEAPAPSPPKPPKENLEDEPSDERVQEQTESDDGVPVYD